MNRASQLFQLAHVAARHGSLVVEGSPRISAAGIQQYWSASKCRLDRWGRALRRHEAVSAVPTIEEIFSSEPLAQAWTAVCHLHDCRHAIHESEPVARAVLVGHAEAKYRALRIMAEQSGLTREQAMRLNRSRRDAALWNARLLEYVAPHRMAETSGLASLSPVVLPLVKNDESSADLPNADLNLAVATSILACFDPALFSATGMFHALWTIRLLHAADDAHGLVQELLFGWNETALQDESRHRRPMGRDGIA